MADNHQNQEWENEEAAVERPLSAVISVRFPTEFAQRVFAEAEARGVPTSTFIRSAVEQYLDTSIAGATHDWTISSNDVSVAFYSGRSTQGRTAGQAHALDDVLVSGL